MDYIPDTKKKVDKGIPKGITETKPGRFLVQFTKDKVRYVKFFSAEPRKQALQDAIEWMHNKKESLKTQEEGSETK
jgi:hypothetical protein